MVAVKEGQTESKEKETDLVPTSDPFCPKYAKEKAESTRLLDTSAGVRVRSGC